MEVPSNNVLPMVAPGRPDAIDPKYLAMAAAQMHSEGRLFEPTLQPQAVESGKGPRVADAGGGNVPPLEIETLLSQHAQGKLTSAQVKAGMPQGWTANLRGKYGPYSVFGPDGKEHMVQP